jgi:hypothetical protein
VRTGKACDSTVIEHNARDSEVCSITQHRITQHHIEKKSRTHFAEELGSDTEVLARVLQPLVHELGVLRGCPVLVRGHHNHNLATNVRVIQRTKEREAKEAKRLKRLKWSEKQKRGKREARERGKRERQEREAREAPASVWPGPPARSHPCSAVPAHSRPTHCPGAPCKRARRG